jgi:hypothetical protein
VFDGDDCDRDRDPGGKPRCYLFERCEFWKVSFFCCDFTFWSRILFQRLQLEWDEVRYDDDPASWTLNLFDVKYLLLVLTVVKSRSDQMIKRPFVHHCPSSTHKLFHLPVEWVISYPFLLVLQSNTRSEATFGWFNWESPIQRSRWMLSLMIRYFHSKIRISPSRTFSFDVNERNASVVNLSFIKIGDSMSTRFPSRVRGSFVSCPLQAICLSEQSWIDYRLHSFQKPNSHLLQVLRLLKVPIWPNQQKSQL